ncbi:MAG: hypothetical protein HGA77_09980 [Chlorobiaceae bacterium]|nr:hypothetical protein [Chlorobiaceae bacterium]
MNNSKFSPNTAQLKKHINNSRKTVRTVFRLLFSCHAKQAYILFIFFTCLLTNFLFTTSDAQAASFSVSSSRTLTAVQVTELGLSGSGTAYNEGSYDAGVTWDGVVSSPLTSLDQVYTGSSVQRVDIQLWYYQFNKNTESQPTFTPTYRIFSKTGGIENKLSHSTSTSSTVNATITAQPIVTSKYSGSTYRSYGYATITIDLTSARRSGTYQGTVQISIIYI